MAIAPDQEGQLLRKLLTAKGGSQPVLDSVNFFYKSKLEEILSSYRIETANGDIAIFTSPFLVRPDINDLRGNGRPRSLFPYEARRSRLSYMAKLWSKLNLYQKDGRLIESIDVFLGKIPVMIGSELCHTFGKTEEERYKMGEPEKDPQAYFIIKGAEKVLLNIEKLRVCVPYMYEEKEKFMVRYTSQTLTDTTVNIVFEDKYDIHVTFTKIGITDNSINVFYIFYVLGLSRPTIIDEVYQIMDTFIVDSDPKRQERRRREMRYYMQTTVNSFQMRTQFDRTQVLNVIADTYRDPTILTSFDRNRELIKSIRTELFKNIPMGKTQDSPETISALYAKIRLLASMIVKYVDFQNGYRDVDDRDAWGNKQLTDAGKHMTTRFIQIWKFMITTLQTKAKSNNYKTATQLKNGISQNYMAEQFISSFTKELWGNSRGQRDVSIVDILKRDNLVAAWSHIRRINTPTNRRAQIREKRLIHNTQWGLICPVFTPEGEACLEVSTLVTKADGSEVQIGDLKDGDEIMTVNPKTHKLEPSKIIKHFVKSSSEYGKGMLKITAMSKSILCTEDHMFLTDFGWVEAKDLINGKHQVLMMTDKPIFVDINSITSESPCMVADFTTVSDNHSMISGGFVTHNCGLVKDSAVTVYISLDRGDSVVRSRISNYYSQTPQGPHQNPLYINGIPIGYCNSDELHKELLRLRRTQQLYFDTGIVKDMSGDLWIFTNDGRLCRPLMIVDPDTQQLMIDVLGLRNADLGTLLSKGVMEYLDAAEQEQPYNYIAETVRHLRARRELIQGVIEKSIQTEQDPNATQVEKNNAIEARMNTMKRRRYTHCEIDPTAILGISAISMPFGEFNPGPRDTYQSSMVRQALGPNSSRIELRYDTTMRTTIAPEVPSISTDAHEWLGLDDYPQGQEVILAITTYGGQNQEDAIVFNKDAIDLGMFMMMIYHSYSETICQSKSRKEKLQIPEYPQSRAIHYSKLDPSTGIVRVGETVTTGDCLVGKVIIDNTTGDIKNDSLYVEIGKQGVVDEVYVTENAESCKLIRIRIRELRKIKAGDKLASRYSQKGTIGAVLPGDQMPWVQSEHPELNGVRPHLIFNPHGIPSRMTMGKIFEILLSKYSGIVGQRLNATSFRRFSIEGIQDELQRMGFSRSGKEKLINGITGREMDVDIYVGPAYYQLLRHLVDDKMQARGTGSVQFITRQATAGIRKGGGLRFGEMERDALVEYGAGYLTQERMSISSDLYESIVCRECGQPAIMNVDMGIPRCRKCPSSEFTRIQIPYSFKLMSQLLAAAGIKIKLITKEV
jgi:DNA-directed RNA polymerase beta subunit